MPDEKTWGSKLERTAVVSFGLRAGIEKNLNIDPYVVSIVSHPSLRPGVAS